MSERQGLTRRCSAIINLYPEIITTRGLPHCGRIVWRTAIAERGNNIAEGTIAATKKNYQRPLIGTCRHRDFVATIGHANQRKTTSEPRFYGCWGTVCP